MIAGKIDVSKIDKEELYKGSKGTYLDIVLYANTDDTGAEVPDQYGYDGVIKQSLSKASREAKKKQPILGNYKVKDNTSWASKVQPAKAFKRPQQEATIFDDSDSEIPF